MRAKITNDAGFTLLEMLVALTIFAVGMLGIAGLQINALDFNDNSNTRTVATAIAQGIMEQILVMKGDDPVFKSDSTDTVWDLDTDTSATSLTVPGSGTYSATWSVDSDAPVKDIATISITVTPQASSSRAVTLTNYRNFW